MWQDFAVFCRITRDIARHTRKTLVIPDLIWSNKHRCYISNFQKLTQVSTRLPPTARTVKRCLPKKEEKNRVVRENCVVWWKRANYFTFSKCQLLSCWILIHILIIFLEFSAKGIYYIPDKYNFSPEWVKYIFVEKSNYFDKITPQNLSIAYFIILYRVSFGCELYGNKKMVWNILNQICPGVLDEDKKTFLNKFPQNITSLWLILLVIKIRRDHLKWVLSIEYYQ